jgi:hypothetical protein
VSQVLLSQFGDADGRLITHWLDGRSHLQSVRRAARQNDFIAVDADRYERMWGAVEGPAADALRALNTDDPVLVQDHSGVLKDLMAVHFARASSMEVMWLRAMDNTLPDRRAGMLNDPVFLRTMRTAPELAGLSEVEIVDGVCAYIGLRSGPGSQAFADALVDQYDKVRNLFAEHHLEVGWAAKSEFLLPDVPCVTIDSERNVVGVLNGASIGPSDAVIMPASPRHVLSLSRRPPKEPWRVLNGRQVGSLNLRLVRGARRYVMYRPGSDVGEFTRNVLRPSSNHRP